MKTLILLSIFLFAFLFPVHAQKRSIVFTPNLGIGFADGTTCLALGGNLGYQLSENRISICILSGSKKRREYSNGDFKDALIGNFTLKYSKIFHKKSISIIPD